MADAIGILAYGSLIDEPGPEIEPAIVRRIACRTPFKVEFARTSRTRKGGPTLVPDERGSQVAAEFLIVDLPLTHAADRLYRREIRNFEANISYVRPEVITPNSVVIGTIRSFEDVETVLYTRIAANIEGLTATTLAQHAIESARVQTDGKDGISYLINAKRRGIQTPLSTEYESEILRLTGARNLEMALANARA
jgi:hypothetical protein